MSGIQAEDDSLANERDGDTPAATDHEGVISPRADFFLLFALTLAVALALVVLL